jgi:hypothetical protein
MLATGERFFVLNAKVIELDDPINFSVTTSCTPVKWQTWKHLREKKGNKYIVRIPDDSGVYEVRVNWQNHPDWEKHPEWKELEKWKPKWLSIGKTLDQGLSGRVRNKLFKGKGHDATSVIYKYVREELKERHLEVEDDNAFYALIELGWAVCEDPSLIEVLLHREYKPVFIDDNLRLSNQRGQRKLGKSSKGGEMKGKELGQ